jgi:hypothetical protein
MPQQSVARAGYGGCLLVQVNPLLEDTYDNRDGRRNIAKIGFTGRAAAFDWLVLQFDMGACLRGCENKNA